MHIQILPGWILSQLLSLSLLVCLEHPYSGEGQRVSMLISRASNCFLLMLTPPNFTHSPVIVHSRPYHSLQSRLTSVHYKLAVDLLQVEWTSDKDS